MKKDIVNLLADLMIKDNPTLVDELKREQAQLDKIKCLDTNIGNWLKDRELSVLLDILDAPDSYIRKHFPKVEAFSYEERQALAVKVQTHVGICEHCILKIHHDTNFELKTDSAKDHHQAELKKVADKKSPKSQSRGRSRSARV